MNNKYEEFRAKVFSAMRGLAKDSPEFSDAEMLVASSDVTASLKRSTIHKNIDLEWVDKIEETIPYLDLIVRNPTIMIEDQEEILPVELSRNIGEKTVKHLAQHTNMILTITEKDEVIPQKLLNVFHEETLLTYENKFINTLLARLSAFVDKRFKALKGGYGTERNYKFNYATEFEHFASEDSGRNQAKLKLSIELTSPLTAEISETDMEANERYSITLARIQKISNALMSYMSSPYVRTLGRNYIRPPVIRTNAILKNKNMKACLNLWEYIESFDKVGYSFVSDEYAEMPSDHYITDLYSSVALQYTNFYNGVAENPEDNRLLSKRHLSEVYPEFESSFDIEELEDYQVYDSEYKKTVPVSRLMNNRKKLSDDERRLRLAIIVSLKADEMLNAEQLAKEAEERRLARERRRAEEEDRRRAEEEARRLAEEEARRLAEEEEARRRAEEIAAALPVEIRYRRSFMSRYIQAESFVQDYYTVVKNVLLSYKGVKVRTSWSKETYKNGRTPVAKIDVKGKTLYLWLALNPAEFVDTKYRFIDVSEKRGGEDYPMLLRIKSLRGVKYAVELITTLMDRLGLVRIEREYEDYHLPYEDNDALLERGLIKMVLPRGITLDDETELVKANLKELLGGFGRKNTASSELPEAVDEDADEIPEETADANDAVDEENEVSSEVETDVETEEVAYETDEASEDAAEPTENTDEVVYEEVEVQPEYEEIYEDAEPAYEEVYENAEPTDENDASDQTEVTEEVAEEEPVAVPAAVSLDDEAEIEEPVSEEPQSTISDSTMEKALERMIDKMISKDDESDDDQYVIVNVGGAPCILKKRASSDKNRDFAYADGDEASSDENAVVIPFTREQYLALPRKKKKSVLMNVKKMIAYRNTRTLLDLLESMHTDNPRILERMRKLEEKLAEESKFLPNSPLWEESVKRLKK